MWHIINSNVWRNYFCLLIIGKQIKFLVQFYTTSLCENVDGNLIEDKDESHLLSHPVSFVQLCKKSSQG